MNNIYSKEWNESFKRNENNILYPKEEVVKFLNRFIKKKISYENNFKQIIELEFDKNTIKGLDFGCGTGRQTILMKEFLIDAYGCDISIEAIEKAKQNAKQLGYSDLQDKLIVIKDHCLPYQDNFFDFTISEACLDSMNFNNAKESMKEIARVTKKFIYFSLISVDSRGYKLNKNGETIVKDEHEFGTIQSYFDESKIDQLIKNINFKIIYKRKIIESDENNIYLNSRYYVVIERI